MTGLVRTGSDARRQASCWWLYATLIGRGALLCIPEVEKSYLLKQMTCDEKMLFLFSALWSGVAVSWDEFSRGRVYYEDDSSYGLRVSVPSGHFHLLLRRL